MSRPGTYIPFIAAFLLAVFAASGIVDPATVRLLYSGAYTAMSVLVVAAFLPAFWDAVREERVGKNLYLTQGILVLWLSIGVSQLWVSVAIWMGRPNWLTQHWILSLCYALAALSGFYFLRVPDSVTPHGRWGYVTLAIVIAVIIFTFLLIVNTSGGLK